MQTILACGFGRDVNILQGEADCLTEAATDFFTHQQANQRMSFDTLNFIWSEQVHHLL